MSKLTRPKRYSARWVIGVWATVWWAVTGLYLVLVVWDTKVSNQQHPHLLIGLAIIIAAVWIIGAIKWLYLLDKEKTSRREALKDLFFRVRR